MTASLPPVQPASTPSASSASPSADNRAEVPFSQVLSGEVAQQRNRAADQGSHTHETRKTSQTEKARSSEKTGHAQQAEAAPTTRDTSTREDTPADATSSASAAVLPDAAALAAATDTATPAADALLALALNPDLLKPQAAPTQSAGDDSTETFAPRGDPLSRGAARDLPGDARRARADAASLAADAVTQSAARAGSDAAALAARTDSARVAERQPDFTSALAQVQAGQAQVIQAQSTQAASLATAQLQTSDRLSPNVGTTAWNQALGDKIVWMAAGAQQSATLTLNPPDLGPLQVVLNVSNDQASAHFMAAQPEVRQALEAALPRLREMMQDAGIQLGQANVSADTPRQQDTQDRTASGAPTAFGNRDGAEDLAGMALPPPTRTGRGLVDTFA